MWWVLACMNDVHTPAHAYRSVAIIVAICEAEPRFFKANISEGQYAPERV